MTPGTLIVGLTPPASGFQVGTLKGTSVVNPKGMEIDLAKAIAAKLGLKKIVWYNQASFAKSYAPGPEALRPLLRRRDDHAGALQERRLLDPVHQCGPGRDGAQGPHAGAEVDRRPQEADAVRAGRHHGRRLHQGSHQARQGALPEHDGDHVPAAGLEAVRRRRSTTSRSSVPRPPRSRASTGRSSAASSPTSSTGSCSRRAASCARSSTPSSRA